MSKLLTVYAIGGGMLGLTLILTVFAQCFWQTSQGDVFDWNSVNTSFDDTITLMYSAMVRWKRPQHGGGRGATNIISVRV